MTARSSRRSFLGHSTALLGGSLAAALPEPSGAGSVDEIRVGLVGCGHRGSGAAAQALAADRGTRLVAMADLFGDQLEASLDALSAIPALAERLEVPPERRFLGFDAYARLLEEDVDVVLLATPPHFRPLHFQASVQAGKHTFVEKPGAVDAAGTRSLLATSAEARRRGLSVVAGLDARYAPRWREIVQRVESGALGTARSLHTVRYGAESWKIPRQPGWGDMEAQLRNWHHFAWLSGDFLSEQFIHQLDQARWLLGDALPLRCFGTGGRQSRTGADTGHVFDHFSLTFEFGDGVTLFATTRQQAGASQEKSTRVFGSEGVLSLDRAGQEIRGAHPWKSAGAGRMGGHQEEQNALFASLRSGVPIHDGERLALSSQMAILGRLAAYTGQSLTWDQALASEETLGPEAYRLDAAPPASEVARPGLTPFR